MGLKDYLDARGESQAGFARRSRLPQQTVNAICARGYARDLEVAERIVTASRREPAPDGGTVRYEDLMEGGGRDRRGSRRRRAVERAG